MRTPASSPHSSYTLLHLDEATPAGTLFGARRGRATGAIGTAAAAHALVVLSLWGLAQVPPAVRPSQPSRLPGITPFVFRGLGDDGGRRGGGGDRSPEPAPLSQTRPGGVIAASAARRPPISPPDAIAPETPEPQVLNLAVQPLDAGLIPQVGSSTGPSAPTSARGPGDGPGTGPNDGPGAGTGTRGPGSDDGPVGIGDGVSPPQLLYKTQPQYTPEAMRAKLQGVVRLSGVVTPDGTLVDIRVARSLDAAFGLDQEAIRCVRRWRFRAGMKDGRPVPVVVTIEVAFNLR